MTNNVKSPLWIGTWSLGGQGFGACNQQESQAMLDMAYDYGLRHWDTAPIYAKGQSEYIIGKCTNKKRDRVVISSKAGLHWKGNSVIHDASKEAITQSVEASLKRLNTSYLDMLYLHWPDPKTPLYQSIETLKTLQKKGLTRYWGLSNLNTHQLDLLAPLPKTCFHQVAYNPLRVQHYPIIQKSLELGLEPLITSPFEQGLWLNPALSKKPLSKKDIRRRNSFFKNTSLLKTIHHFHILCHQEGLAAVQLLLTWFYQQPIIHSLCPGPRTCQQLQDLYSAWQQRYQPITTSQAWSYLNQQWPFK